MITLFPSSATADLADLVRITLLGVGFSEPGLFGGERANLDDGWRAWLRGPWLELEESVERAYLAAHRRDFEAAEAEDARLRSVLRLTPEMETRNQKLAALIAASMKGAKHQSLWRKLASRVEDGSSDGFAAVLFAVRAAQYHVGPLAAKLGYLYCEWRAAREARGVAGNGWENFARATPLGEIAERKIHDSDGPKLCVVGRR